MTNIELFCLIRGDTPAAKSVFLVEIATSKFVASLKKQIIQENQNRFKNIDAAELKLWGVSVPLDDNTDIMLSQLVFEDNESKGIRELLPAKRLSAYFSDKLEDGHIYIIAEPPIPPQRMSSAYEYAQSISTSMSAIAQNIKTHRHFKFLGSDLSFLKTLTRAEKRKVTEIFNNMVNPNPLWTKEIQEVHPWVQNLYGELAAIWELTVNLETRHGGQRDEIYGDHYISRPELSHLCDAKADPIDFTRCWTCEDKPVWQSVHLSKALVQCFRYSAGFFEDSANRTLIYISIITDARNYRLYYAYWSGGDMKMGLTNDYNWRQETIHIIGRVFKTFKSNFPLRAAASPRVFGNIDPNSKIDNFVVSDLVMEQANPSDFFMNQGIRNRAIYDVILEWAKKLSTSGLPIVTTTTGDVEACRLLGVGSDSIIFEGCTTSNVRVVIKYSLHSPPLKREAETLKILNEVKDIPKLLHEHYGSMIPYIVTSMVGQKVYKVNAWVACDIIIDILEVLKSIHGHNYIHNDIHPSNIVNVDGKYRLIDFGLAVQQSDKRETVPEDWPKGHIVFASHNWGKYPGAGDDLEALCYTIAFMYDQDKRYWHATAQDPYKAIHLKEEKLSYLFDGLPQIFRHFFDYVYDLDITVTPDYEYWQQQFRQTARNSYSPKKHRSEMLSSPGHELESERRIRPRT